MFCLHVGSRGLPSSETRTYHDEHDVHFPSMEQDHGFSHDDVGVLADEIRRRLLAIGVDQADIDNMDDLDDDDEPEQDAAAAALAVTEAGPSVLLSCAMDLNPSSI